MDSGLAIFAAPRNDAAYDSNLRQHNHFIAGQSREPTEAAATGNLRQARRCRQRHPARQPKKTTNLQRTLNVFVR